MSDWEETVGLDTVMRDATTIVIAAPADPDHEMETVELDGRLYQKCWYRFICERILREPADNGIQVGDVLLVQDPDADARLQSEYLYDTEGIEEGLETIRYNGAAGGRGRRILFLEARAGGRYSWTHGSAEECVENQAAIEALLPIFPARADRSAEEL